MRVRACGADGDASEAERQGRALFIEHSLPLLAQPCLASLLAQPALHLFCHGMDRLEGSSAGAWFSSCIRGCRRVV